MNFERHIDVKKSMSLGIRGMIKEAFDKKNFLFQDYICDAMEAPSNWDYERKTWKKIVYYIIEVRNIKSELAGITWAFYIPDAADKASLFYIEKSIVINSARERIDRVAAQKYWEIERAQLIREGKLTQMIPAL